MISSGEENGKRDVCLEKPYPYSLYWLISLINSDFPGIWYQGKVALEKGPFQD